MVENFIKYDNLFKNVIPNAIGDIKIFTKHDPWEINQNISSVTQQEHDIWKNLFQNVDKLTDRYASAEFLEGKIDLMLSSTQFPNLNEISKIIESKTNWRVVTVAGFLDEYLFFELNGTRSFPSTDIIRLSERFSDKYGAVQIQNEYGYTPEPDIFHDVFGHMPFLTNQAYCDFLEEIGSLGLEILKNECGLSQQLVAHNLKRLQNFAWWTYEYGLLKKQSEPDSFQSEPNDIDYEIYGAGILSSRNEIINIVECAQGKSSRSRFIPYDIEEIAMTRFDYSDIQDRYFVIDSMDDLYKSFRNNKDLFRFEGEA